VSDELDDITAARLKQPDPPKPRATQAQLERAIARYSTAAGSVQPALTTPLTKEELASGNSPGYEPAITSVDCSPRPRYGESQAKFERRMASYGVDMAALRKEVAQRNRKAALRSVEAHAGEAFPLGVAYWTQCACGWCGLKVGDPEVARREYDAHPCAAEGVGQLAADRAQAHAGKSTMPARRTSMLLQPSEPPEVLAAKRSEHSVDVDDESEQRFALLEGIPK
jgi:hypothetical protein